MVSYFLIPLVITVWLEHFNLYLSWLGLYCLCCTCSLLVYACSVAHLAWILSSVSLRTYMALQNMDFPLRPTLGWIWWLLSTTDWAECPHSICSTIGFLSFLVITWFHSNPRGNQPSLVPTLKLSTTLLGISIKVPILTLLWQYYLWLSYYKSYFP